MKKRILLFVLVVLALGLRVEKYIPPIPKEADKPELGPTQRWVCDGFFCFREEFYFDIHI